MVDKKISELTEETNLSDINYMVGVKTATNETVKFQPNVLVAQSKYDATTAPTSSNDSSQGYVVGSSWVDTTANLAYVCIDSTAGSAIWKVSSLDSFNVKQFGAVGDGVNDDTVAIQNALNASKALFFPKGTYKVTATLSLQEGSMLTAENQLETIINSRTLNAPLANLTLNGTDKRGVNIQNFTFECNYGVSINDRTAEVLDGSGDAPILGCVIKNNRFLGDSIAGSFGFSGTKMFDSVMKQNYFSRFESLIELVGCDINKVSQNRLVFMSKYGIVEYSSSTFGSQNLIEHNDILAPTASGATLIKSSSRHAIIRDNYFENTTSNVLDAVIDWTADGLTGIGSNPDPDELFHADITGNRIDANNINSINTYKMHSSFRTLNIDGIETVGATHAPSIFNGDVTIRYNSVHGRSLNITNCRSFGTFNSYNGTLNNIITDGGLMLNAYTSGAFINKDQSIQMQLKGDYVNIPLASTGNTYWLAMDGESGGSGGNKVFTSGESYIMTVVARSTVDGDSIRIGTGTSAYGSPLNDFVLGDNYKAFSWNTLGRPDTENLPAFYIKHKTGNTGDLQIKSISMKSVAVNYKDVNFSWNPPIIPDGSQEVKSDISFTGAKIAEHVVVIPPYDLQGMILNSYVSANNVVTAVIYNNTGGDIDLPSSTSWKVRKYI